MAKNKPTGRVIYGKKKSKSADAASGINHYIIIEHPEGAVKKTERIDYYCNASSARRGAMRKAKRLGYIAQKEVKNGK